MGENKGLSAEEVYGALSDQIEYVDHKLDDAMVKIWSPGGSYTFENLPAPSAQTFRFAYEVTDDFTTDARFVEGAGIDYPAGTTVGVVNRGTDADPVYMYDVSTGAVLVDPVPTQGSTNAVSSGGTYDAIEPKADKVSNATSGHLAGLDSNGNLTDSGVSPTEDVTVEGNPVTFESPFEQDAKSVVVTAKPIQDLHGYDHPWPAGGGKNKCESYVATALTEQYVIALYIETDLQASTTYAISFDDIAGNSFYANENVFVGDVYIATVNGRNSIIVTTKDNLAKDQTTYENGKGWIILKNMYPQSVTPDISKVQIELGSSPTSYAPYSNICPISGIDEVEIGVSGKNLGKIYYGYITGDSSIGYRLVSNENSFSLIAEIEKNKDYKAIREIHVGNRFRLVLFKNYPTDIQTLDSVEVVSDATLDEYNFNSGVYNYAVVTINYNSSLSNDIDAMILDANNSDTSYEPYVSHTTTIPLPSTLYDGDVDVTEGDADSRYGYIASYNGETLPGAWISDRDVYTGSNSPTIGAEVCYELATPTTLSFTPTDVELLEGTNVVTTNAERVAVTYGRSLWQDIDKLKTDTEGKLDKSDVATIEGDTASKAYSVNDFMLRADGLYKVTQPIAQNASITASNTTKTTIGAVLTALLNS